MPGALGVVTVQRLIRTFIGGPRAISVPPRRDVPSVPERKPLHGDVSTQEYGSTDAGVRKYREVPQKAQELPVLS